MLRRITGADPKAIEGLLSGLSRDAIAVAASNAVVTTYRSGETIINSGDRWPCALILEGSARLQIAANNGREATLCMLSRGTMLGFSSLFRTHLARPSGKLSLSAAEMTTVAVFTPAIIADLGRQHCDFAMHLVGNLVELSSVLVDASGRFAFMTVRQRVAAHLLLLAQARGGESNLPVLATTQHQLAQSVGSVREVVARVLRDFRTEGILGRGSKRQLIVLDADRLANAAFATQ